MNRPEAAAKHRARHSLRASLLMLAFGLGILGYLVAIGRGDWFHLRPASGTAAAMWHASDRAAPPADAR